MSRRFSFPIILIILLVATVVLFERAAIAVVKSQLKSRLALDTVLIEHFKMLSLGKIRLEGITLEKKDGFKINARKIIVGFRLPRIIHQEIESIAIENASAEYQMAKVEDLFLTADRSKDDGQLRIAKASYNKAQVYNIKSPVQLKAKDFVFSDLTGDFLEGKVNGNAKVTVAGVPEFYAAVQFTSLNIERLIDDFELQEKIEMTGTMNGAVEIAGGGAALEILGGGFKMASGGKLIIKDRKVLANIVQQAYLETAVETLQDYHYNTGGLQLSLEEDNNIALDMNLDGDQGKRDFKIVYHPPGGPNRR